LTDFFGMYMRGSLAAMKGAAKLGSAAAQAASGAASNYAAGKGARRGVLAPGDPPPPPNAGSGYYDYRGVVDWKRVPAELQTAEFPLGRLVHPSRGPRQPIALRTGDVQRHVTVVGPAGSGKTRWVIVPWIIAALRAGWSVVALDVKGNLMRHVREAVRESGQPLHLRPVVLDYTDPAHSVKWNWCAELTSDRAIGGAVKAINGSKPPPHTAEHFFYRSEEILRGLLELTAESPNRDQITAGRIYQILKKQQALAKNVNRNPQSQAYPRLADLLSLYPDQYTQETATVAAKLSSLANPAIEAVTNRVGFRMRDVLQSPTLVSVVARVEQDGQMAAMLGSLFVNQLLFSAYDRFANWSGVPVLVVLDEAARLQQLVDFESMLSLGREAGIHGLIALQDAAQFKDKDERSVIFSNSGTLIYLPHTSALSAQLLSDRLGQHPVQTASMSVSPSPHGIGTQRTPSWQTQMAPVLGQREISNLPFGERAALVHASPLLDPPFLVDLEYNRH
jgi:type IV secretory pathway TraG/TraD family ATPase VirD4